ncbi:MAG TPA: FkbM family methyltransferase [Xanthobacteraceae bacterium]|nr:FkbM family methyltransferase [Xanthobacteraceae bacterium]
MISTARRKLRSAIASALRAGLKVSGGRVRRLLSDALKTDDQSVPLTIETIATSRGPIKFYCLGALPLWRVRTLFTKEPETIEWIDGFDEGEVFWDIGANVGIYSLYAATHRGIRVLAFEPAAGNYYLLNRNIELNGIDDHVQAYCVALSDESGIRALNMQMTELGGALSSFGEPVDNFGKRFTPGFRQGMIGYTVDAFVGAFRPPFPNHIKIDVDGIEDRIIAGAAKTLADPRMKSLSVELDSSREAKTGEIVDRIESCGLRLVVRRQSEMVASGEYRTIFNYQFQRAV